MASGIFDQAKEELLSGSIDLTTDTIRAILIDAADHTISFTADNFFSDITTAARIGNSGATGRGDGVALGSKTVTAGVFDAADATLTTVTGDQAEGILIYKDSGVDGTSTLIAYIDSGTGLPVTPSGGDITFQWDSGANKIFAL